MSTTEHPLWEEELMPYIDGQLQGDIAARVALHLTGCSECAKAVEGTKNLSSEMFRWEVEPAPDRMKEAVLSGLYREDRSLAKRWNRRLVWGVVTGAAAVAALLLFAVNLPMGHFDQSTAIRSSSAPFIESPTSSPPPPSVKSGERESPEAILDMAQSSENAKSVGDYQAIISAQLQQPQRQKAALGRLQKESADASSGPMIIRSLHMTMVARDLDVAHKRIDDLVRQAQGYVDQFSLRGEKGAVRTLTATLRLPSDQLETGLVELRKLGPVKAESQNSSDVTSSYVDLVARQNNARNTEQRLLTLLRERTGNLKDVVEVERELSSTRETIERMEAQRKTLQNQVQYATVQVEMSEEYRAAIEPSQPSTGSQLRNAAVEGYQLLSNTALALATVALTYGPTFLLGAVLFSAFAFLAFRLRRQRIG